MNKESKFQPVLIIPVYLKLNKPDEIPASEGISLLKRAVESLNIFEDDKLSIIAVFCIDADRWTDEFDAGIRKVVMDFLSKFSILVFTEKNMINLKRYLKEKGFLETTDRLGVCGYPNIRNCGLIISNALGADVAIFIDNDEVVEDKDFLRIACEYLDTAYKGIKVHGKSGFYISRKGEIIEKPFFRWWQTFWNKGKLMSDTMEKILETKGRLAESPIILGGNLVLHKNLFSKIPFDPLIPRGEDIDYLINSRRLGFNIFFDKKLRVKHLHPERTIIFKKAELRGDIERFVYEREKIEGSDISLDPYPGYFLKKTFPLKAMLTILLLAVDLLLRFKIIDALEIGSYKRLVFQKHDDVWQEYLKFQRDWKKLMDFINKNSDDIIPLLQ